MVGIIRLKIYNIYKIYQADTGSTIFIFSKAFKWNVFGGKSKEVRLV